ncbi:hypothetical protein [Rhodoferax sp.]|uniref:hypothetical protein n=1 Tax=Rhodoferax sp. TaxID=50421 RepID=UPI00374C9D3B
MKILKTAPLFCLALGLLALLPQARALDIPETLPASDVTDKMLTIGARTLTLPDGNWTYVTRTQWSTTQGPPPRSPVFAAYAMDLQNGRMQSGVVLELPVRSTPSADWRTESCKLPSQVFHDDFGSDWKTPECLQVFKRVNHLVGPQGEFYGLVQQWAQTRGVKLPGPVYEVVYTKYARNDYGRIRVFVPLRAVASEDDAIAWAKQLPALLRGFMDKRDTAAKLPPIPALPMEASAPLPAEPPARVPFKASGFAQLGDVDAVPVGNESVRAMYREFLTRPMPRAFVLSTEKALYTVGRNPPDLNEPADPAERALGRCRKVSETPCQLYAVDDLVVWVKPADAASAAPVAKP